MPKRFGLLHFGGRKFESLLLQIAVRINQLVDDEIKLDASMTNDNSSKQYSSKWITFTIMYNMYPQGTWDKIKVTITSLLINIHEMFSVLIFSTQQDATETW